MPKFQLTYSVNSKTQYSELSADSFQIVKDVFYSLNVGELLEIREIVYADTRIIKDDKDYIHSANIKIYSKDKLHLNSFRIPKVKKIINEIELQNLVLLNVKINHLKPEIIQTTFNFKQ